MGESERDEILRRWRVATDRYNDLDRRYKAIELELSELSDQAEALMESRDRTPRDLVEEEKAARLAALTGAVSAEVQQIKEEAAQRISEIEEDAARRIRLIHDGYRMQHDAVETEFESRLAPLRGDDEDDEWDPWDSYSTPEFDAVRQEIDALRTEHAKLGRSRIEARHELTAARADKLEAQRRR